MPKRSGAAVLRPWAPGRGVPSVRPTRDGDGIPLGIADREGVAETVRRTGFIGYGAIIGGETPSGGASEIDVFCAPAAFILPVIYKDKEVSKDNCRAERAFIELLKGARHSFLVPTRFSRSRPRTRVRCSAPPTCGTRRGHARLNLGSLALVGAKITREAAAPRLTSS